MDPETHAVGPVHPIPPHCAQRGATAEELGEGAEAAVLDSDVGALLGRTVEVAKAVPVLLGVMDDISVDETFVVAEGLTVVVEPPPAPPETVPEA